MTLYRKELGRIIKSLIFIIATATIVLFAYSQGVFPPYSTIAKPEPGAPSYGMKASDDPALIMPEAAESLFAQYSENRYITYPNGFIKYVKLGQSDRAKMGEIVNELSIDKIEDSNQDSDEVSGANDGSYQITGDSLQPNGDGSFQIIIPEIKKTNHFKLNPNITWEQFSELMEQADNLLGGGSDFSENWLSHRFGEIPVTYEDALADYELMVSYDKLTGAHARLFCDYMGIIMGLVPVFPAVFLCLSDRKNISQVIYTRHISSVRFILARFLALITGVMIPVFIMCTILTGIHGMDYGWGNIDLLAYFKYAVIWILPIATVTTAIGLFFTVLTDTPVAIAIQLVWWFMDISGGEGAYSFFGLRPLQLMPRHNALGKTQIYMDYLPNLIQNRIWMTIIAVLLVILTIFIFNIKRKGGFHVTISQRGKVQSSV